MKTKLLKSTYALLLMLITISMGCTREDIIDNSPVDGLEEKPAAAFNFTVADPKDPFTYKFDNKSSNFKEVRWDFADDSTSSELSPTHTFLNTGTYKVKMVVLNGEGYWAQREETIKINPSSYIQVATKILPDRKMELSFETAMEIESASWTHAVSSSQFDIFSTEKTANLSFAPGEFKRIFLTVITPKKSKATIEFLLSETGQIKDLTNFDNIFTISHDNSGGPDANEGSKKMIDNNTNTKVFIGGVGNSLTWQFEYYVPQIINGYRMTSGNDAQERDPKEWKVEGSNDGTTWTEIDHRSNEEFPSRYLSRTFTFNNSTAYKYYKFSILQLRSGTNFQMCELRLLQIPQ